MLKTITPTARCLAHRAVCLFSLARAATGNPARSPRTALACAALALAGPLTPPALAQQSTMTLRASDRVSLASGQTIHGLVLAETTQQVLLMVRELEPNRAAVLPGDHDEGWPVGAIHWIDRAEIREVVRQPMLADPPPMNTSPSAISLALVPVGLSRLDQIGSHVTAEGLFVALQGVLAQARSLGIDPSARVVLVLHFASRGGQLAEVPWIVEIIKWSHGQFREVIGLVERAESAAGLVALSCDELVFLPGGVLGAAVAYERTPEGVRTLEGPALQNALEIARMAARTGGRDPLLAEAMASPVGLSFDPASGAFAASDAAAVTINPPGTVLTLSSQDAQRFGVARAVVNDVMGLIAHLGIGAPGHLLTATPIDALARRGEAFPLVLQHAELLSDSIQDSLALLESEQTPAAERALVLSKTGQEIDRLAAVIASFPELSRHAGFEPSWLETLRQRLERLGPRPAPAG
jgi:hypothetical protein